VSKRSAQRAEGERSPGAGLADFRVLDLSSGLAGAYATKLFADAGADVVKVGAPPAGAGPLARFLAAGKRIALAAGSLGDAADLVVSDALAAPEPRGGLVVLSITPWGLAGPYRERPWSELTLQAESGSIGTRGLPGQEPFQAGGRITEWVGGTYAAVAALAALHRMRRSGHGELVDFSLFEAITLAGTNYMDLAFRLMAGPPDPEKLGPLPQSVETPSIEPTRDGYVGFCTNSRQQVADFMLLIGRPDLRADEELAQVHGRIARFAEWNEIVHAYTKRHTTAEVIAAAAELRIPVAPVLSGATVRDHEQIVARGALRKNPEGVLVPRRPYRVDFEDPPEPRGVEAPCAEHRFRPRAEHRLPPRAEHRSSPRARPEPAGAPRLPLEGVRILDLTAWWAGPSATAMLAALGADVIHVEAPARPDGMRMVGGMARHRFPAFWEASAFFLAANTNKRGLTLDLGRPEGVALAKRLVAHCDGVIENFTPRVLEGWGLGWDTISALNPRAILVRMPAFGLSGPWRDHTGFAQTMEQLSGLAWITGHPDDQPRIQRGPCDPLAGMHAAWAFLVALEEREATGRGVHVECTMVEAALNAAAEAIVEFGETGRVLERMGNRARDVAVQGLYPAAGSAPGRERWVALSLREAGGQGEAELRAWVAAREREAAVAELLARGVPAAPVADPRASSLHPQHAARGFFEEVEHPVVGRQPVPTVPFRYASVAHWIRRPAPTLGQHNGEILRDLLGLSAAELAALEAAGVIGTRPRH
jgi:crotonobetainyl-CoA:carnitine CoA-transferase CaiB-like acyl-CoA transferase